MTALLIAVVVTPSNQTQATQRALREAAQGEEGPSRSAGPDLSDEDASTIDPLQQDQVLPVGWQSSEDMAWTTSGDSMGFSLLVADAHTGYTWRTVAALAEPGFETDHWIGNVCFTGSGRRAVVVYAPRQFTNRETLFQRGAFAAVVDVVTGQVTKLDVTVSLAYFNPGCGAGETAILTQSGLGSFGKTRLLVLDTAARDLVRQYELDGQVTSAVPVPAGVAAVTAAGLVEIDATGQQHTLAVTHGTPFSLHPDAAGGLAFLEAHGETTAVIRYAAHDTVRELGHGRLTEVELAGGTGGRVFLTGQPSIVTALPSTIIRVDLPVRAELSTTGALALVHEDADEQGANVSGQQAEAQSMSLQAKVLATGATVRFRFAPGIRPSALLAQGRQPALLRSSADTTQNPDRPQGLTEDERHSPVDLQHTCAVPRNDPRTQVYQPHWRQVEWAVDQAVSGNLTIMRPSNWKQSGLPAWSPQGMFPRPGLITGASHRVPAQIMLGVLAQESNLWQASSHVLEGVYGNPLIGNYYGLDIYNKNHGDDWIIRWDKADCGYGVAQVTTGMRLGDPSPDKQRAVALDYATNIAAGLQILEQKWNQTQQLNIRINDNDPARPENWFAALWAYNTGLQPRDAEMGNPSGCTPGPDCHDGRGNFGLGWFNNPANTDYKINRPPFLEESQDDARHPQDWPYPEKVLGWAAYPIIKTDPFAGTYQAGYRQAWWNEIRFRTHVKPPWFLFCNQSNHCDPELAQRCTQADYHCWWNEPAEWKPGCREFDNEGNYYDTCGHEGIRYDPGYPEPPDWNAWYQPNCAGDDDPDAPPGSLVVDDLDDQFPSVRPCADPSDNAGYFSLEFAKDETGQYRSKIDFHQLGGGYGGHFWFAYTYGPAEAARHVTGTWTFDRQIHGWARVLVHVPDHQAHTAQADYHIWLGNGQMKRRIVNQKSLRLPEDGHRWINLGVFQFAGQPRIQLSNITQDGIGNEGIAWDAVAIQPLPTKPRHFVVALGDSYSSGEGAVIDPNHPQEYEGQTDVDGDDEVRRNNCHRSWAAWSRLSTLKDNPNETIGSRENRLDPTLDFHLLACSGAQTENLLPNGTGNAFGELSRGQDGEVSQLANGFLDENTTLVTLTIGGNDAGWSKALELCVFVTDQDCPQMTVPGGTEPLSEWLTHRIRGAVEESIRLVLIHIHQQAPNAKIVLMGYPHLTSNGANCLRGLTFFNPNSGKIENIGISANEAAWMDEMADLLADTMATAADTQRERPSEGDPAVPVWFADPRQEFAGRGVCGDRPLIHAVLVLKTRGEDPGRVEPFPRLWVSQQSFHPNRNGVDAYAAALMETLRRPEIDQ